MFSSTPLFSLLSVLSSSPSATIIPLTVREAASGILGSISLSCWIFLLVPQLIENYRNGSADAISLAFIFVWFVGDVCNLVGALWAGLVPTVTAIAIYFCIADGVLIGQCMYYRIKTQRAAGRSVLEAARESLDSTRSGDGQQNSSNDGDRNASGETQPLLSRTRTRSSSITIPGSGRRRSSAARRSSLAANEPLYKILEETDETGARLWIRNVLSILAIIAVGTLGWTVAYQTGAWTPTPIDDDTPNVHMAIGAQVLGYASAVAYLGARIPQIVKNAREKSCEGLSLLFFILSLLGNATYGAGILSHSTEHSYFVKNLPWLIGSLGTMVEDITIFIQFHIYAQADSNDREVAVA